VDKNISLTLFSHSRSTSALIAHFAGGHRIPHVLGPATHFHTVSPRAVESMDSTLSFACTPRGVRVSSSARPPTHTVTRLPVPAELQTRLAAVQHPQAAPWPHAATASGVAWPGVVAPGDLAAMQRYYGYTVSGPLCTGSTARPAASAPPSPQPMLPVTRLPRGSAPGPGPGFNVVRWGLPPWGHKAWRAAPTAPHQSSTRGVTVHNWPLSRSLQLRMASHTHALTRPMVPADLSRATVPFIRMAGAMGGMVGGMQKMGATGASQMTTLQHGVAAAALRASQQRNAAIAGARKPGATGVSQERAQAPRSASTPPPRATDAAAGAALLVAAAKATGGGAGGSANARGATRSEVEGRGARRYRGVTLCDSGRWRTKIYCNKRTLSIGRFNKPLDAAMAYDLAAWYTRGTSINFAPPAVLRHCTVVNPLLETIVWHRLCDAGAVEDATHDKALQTLRHAAHGEDAAAGHSAARHGPLLPCASRRESCGVLVEVEAEAVPPPPPPVAATATATAPPAAVSSAALRSRRSSRARAVKRGRPKRVGSTRKKVSVKRRRHA